MDLLFKSTYVWWFVTGVFLGLPFVYPLMWPIGIVGGAVFFSLAQQTQPRFQLIVGSWLALSIKVAIASVWVWSVYPIDWLGIELGGGQIGFIGLYWILCSAGIGLGGVLCAWFCQHANQYKRKFLGSYYLVVPLLWVGSEILGSVIFSVLTLGPGSTINTAFSFGYTGYLLAQNDWLVNASIIGGVYGLSFLFALLSLGVLQLKKDIWFPYQIIILLIFLGVYFVPTTTEVDTEAGYHVVTIDVDFLNTEYATKDGVAMIQLELNTAMQSALAVEPDYILLPEDSRFFDQSQHPALSKAIFQFRYRHPPVMIIDSSRAETESGFIQQAYIFDGKQNSATQVSKQYLVPQGEYIPTLFGWIIRLFGYTDAIQSVTQNINYQAGENGSQKELSTDTPGVLFCAESVDPLGVRRILLGRDEVPFVAHIVSHGWFHEPRVMQHQLDIMLRVQAIWNQTYIVSAGRNVAGKVYTPHGGVVEPVTIARGERWRVKEVYLPRYDSQ